MKVAVIGAGAAAAGVLAGLERFARPDLDITVFDIGERMRPASPKLAEQGFVREELSPIYAELHKEHGLAFPPPKSHFGQSLTKLTVEGKPLLWKSEHRGGLTNVWGGGMFPFTDREFAGWPIGVAEMAPHYRIMADTVGVCGEADELDEYFGPDYINRPPLRTSRVMDALRRTVNKHGNAGKGRYRLLAGYSRLALETRAGEQRSCVYCGECMLGCPRESIWSATLELQRYEERGFIRRYLVGRVRSVSERRVLYQSKSGVEESSGPFDRVYIAAGCIGSTEVVMRSLGITTGPVMLDGGLLSFPIFYMGTAGGLMGDEGDYFSLCNLSMMGIPEDLADPVSQVSVYPAFDHLFRFYTPEPLWDVMSRLWHLGRWRTLLGRAYLAGSANRSLRFELKDDQLVIRRGEPPRASDAVGALMHSLRGATNRDGFFIPPVAPGSHGTSSHYSSTFPYGGQLLNLPRDGQIAAGVHLADASTFVGCPAVSPTFTIMANACRTAYESLQS